MTLHCINVYDNKYSDFQFNLNSMLDAKKGKTIQQFLSGLEIVKSPEFEAEMCTYIGDKVPIYTATSEVLRK